MTETMKTENKSECQYCHGEVEYGTTEQGFKGFVHVATGKAACGEQ